MKEPIDYLSTLFVGIDIASRIHVISALDFNEEFYIKMKPVENTREGAALMEQMISDVLEHNHLFKYVVIGMEATGFYGVHLANYLSASDLLAPFSVYWLISCFIVMAPDVTIRFIRTVAMVTAPQLQQSLCYCQESMQP